MSTVFIRNFFPAVIIAISAMSFSYAAIPEIPEYRVALDPGHGGISYQPIEKTGDRYDVLSGKYLDTFKEGASYRNVSEHIIMFQIGSKVKALLAKTETEAGFAQFSKIAAKYSSAPLKRVIIKAFLSRPESMNREKQMKLRDPNDKYRLFDYPGENGETVKGRVSYMNSLKPHLVVSLHCASSTSRDRIGMNAVIVPPYSFFEKGLEILKKKRTDTLFFRNGPYADWFEENYRRSLYKWFLNDSFMYFSGYPLDQKNNPDFSKFKGYGRNMITWAYSDPKGWAAVAAKHPAGAYSDTIAGINPQGAYWDRERSIYETYRRDGGPEGYGGDNFYSANEIIRYALLAVEKKGYHHADLRIAPPYISSWVVPMYVNAVSAYIELGYIKMPSYRHVLVDMQDDVAEGIAVGIYSLFTGIESKGPKDFRFSPKGRKLDFDRYKNKEGKSYFDMVVQ